MRYHQDFVVNGQFGENHALPVGQRPFDGLLERFGAGQLLVRDPGVAGIEARIAGIVFGQRIGCDVVAAPPDVHLLFAEAGRRFALVEPLQYAVMFLVEAPVFLDGDPFLIEPVENTVQGPDGPFQVGGVGFAETESFGFELITIPMTENGPDMDIVENLIKDPSVKGMWNVPKYSNPDGIIYSDETIERIAKMKPAAPDFLLMWDNAYCIHEFDGEFVPFKDILSECEKYGNADMVFEFASTSKVTLPGAGIACFACSEANMEHMTKLIGIQAISFDKMNQLRHVKYLQNKEHTLALMKEHAKIMKPKFDMVVETLEREIKPLGIASWHTPKGGYFVSVNTAPGLAKRTLALAKEAGVVMTSAGATYPYGHDPLDSNIRVAPSLPPVEELEQAMAVFCCCLKLAALEKSKK